MKTNRIVKYIIYTLVVLMIISGCSTSEPESEEVVIDNTEISEGVACEVEYGEYKDSYYEDSITDSNIITINLGDDSSTSDNDSVTIDNNIITIKEDGVYMVSGSLSNGQLLVDAATESNIRIILNNATINNNSSSALYVKSANRVIITLAPNSINTLSDTENYLFEGSDDEPDSTLFSKDDLIINGTGSLEVIANYNHAIRSKDDLILIDGTYIITAVNDGIKGKDSISIKGGTYTITTNGDGIQSNGTDAETGWIAIDGGTFTINVKNDGIQAESDLKISAGTFDITTSSDGITNIEDSKKGLKAGSQIITCGGVFVLNTIDDSVHSDKDITLNGGEFTISSDDDAIHADSVLTIDATDINILESYEGLEGGQIYLEGGTININSSDDGINAAGGTNSTSSDYLLEISGGVIEVNANGDGIDSNNNVNMTGGLLVVHGALAQGDAALDYDGTFNISGGTLVAAGSGGMSMLPSDTSTQKSLSISFNNNMAANDTVNITTADGENILTYTAKNTFNNLVISSPTFASSSEVIVNVDGTLSSNGEVGVNLTDEYDGVNLLTLALDVINTSVNENGEAVTIGGFGKDRGNGGGMPARSPKNSTLP